MKVILLQNIEKIGKKLEIKDVKKGYAMNFLIPRNLARPATKKTMKWLEIQKEISKKEQEEALKNIQIVATKLNGLELNFSMKVGDKGQLFESLTVQKIKDALKEKGFDITKDQIQLKNPIKELGEFSVKIDFDYNLESVIKVIIVKKEGSISIS